MNAILDWSERYPEDEFRQAVRKNEFSYCCPQLRLLDFNNLRMGLVSKIVGINLEKNI